MKGANLLGPIVAQVGKGGSQVDVEGIVEFLGQVGDEGRVVGGWPLAAGRWRLAVGKNSWQPTVLAVSDWFNPSALLRTSLRRLNQSPPR